MFYILYLIDINTEVTTDWRTV